MACLLVGSRTPTWPAALALACSYLSFVVMDVSTARARLSCCLELTRGCVTSFTQPMIICVPPQDTPAPKHATDTAHSTHSQHCGHTALAPGQTTNPRRSADPNLTVYAHPLRRAQTQVRVNPTQTRTSLPRPHTPYHWCHL